MDLAPRSPCISPQRIAVPAGTGTVADILMTPTLNVDLLIIGGGVSGLWLLNRARREGYNAILIEGSQLGSGQTVHGQGFILGQPVIGPISPNDPGLKLLAQMPERWRRHLAGAVDDVDLSQAATLAERTYSWTLDSKKPGGFGIGKLFRRKSSVREATGTPVGETTELPASLRHEGFRGELRLIEGLVVDNRSVVAALAAPVMPYVFQNRGPAVKARDGAFNLRADGREPVVIKARKIVFTAGIGVTVLGCVPLHVWRQHMVMVRGAHLPDDLYVNAIDRDGQRRFNLTSHRDNEGRAVWYVGGALADVGSQFEPAQQIAACRKELAEQLPWVDLREAQFSTVRVDRAAARQRAGVAVLPVVREMGDAITAWPASLSTIPLLVDQVMDMLGSGGVRPEPGSLELLDDWPRPDVADDPWDQDGREWL